jgi:hypothetical protein
MQEPSVIIKQKQNANKQQIYKLLSAVEWHILMKWLGVKVMCV